MIVLEVPFGKILFSSLIFTLYITYEINANISKGFECIIIFEFIHNFLNYLKACSDEIIEEFIKKKYMFLFIGSNFS